MKKLLIITTISDLSIPLFLENKVSSLIDIDFCFFHESLSVIKRKLESTKFDFIYIRDPFTDGWNEKDLKNKLNYIINNSKKTYLIDNIDSVEDIFFEDKLIQYKHFSSFMPKTNILSATKIRKSFDYIIKKRISSRGKGIFFNKKDVPKDNRNDYIIQEKLAIEKEYRIYVIFNKIIPIVNIKTSKTEAHKVKVLKAEKIDVKLKEFVKTIITDNKFDFFGLDIALSEDKYYLLEINRGCQFTTFYKQTKKNLAEIFIKELLKKEAHKYS